MSINKKLAFNIKYVDRRQFKAAQIQFSVFLATVCCGLDNLQDHFCDHVTFNESDFTVDFDGDCGDQHVVSFTDILNLNIALINCKLT